MLCLFLGKSLEMVRKGTYYFGWPKQLSTTLKIYEFQSDFFLVYFFFLNALSI